MIKLKAHKKVLSQQDITPDEMAYLRRLANIVDSEKILEEANFSSKDTMALKMIDAVRLGLMKSSSSFGGGGFVPGINDIS